MNGREGRALAIAELVRTLGPEATASAVRAADNLAKADIDADIVVNDRNVGRGAGGMLAALADMVRAKKPAS
jgi:hypothetical protein